MEININRNKRIIKWANGIALKNFLSAVTFRGHLGFTIAHRETVKRFTIGGCSYEKILFCTFVFQKKRKCYPLFF